MLGGYVKLEFLLITAQGKEGYRYIYTSL